MPPVFHDFKFSVTEYASLVKKRFPLTKTRNTGTQIDVEGWQKGKILIMLVLELLTFSWDYRWIFPAVIGYMGIYSKKEILTADQDIAVTHLYLGECKWDSSVKPLGGLRKEENLGQRSRKLSTCKDQAEERRQEDEGKVVWRKRPDPQWGDVPENTRGKSSKKVDIRMKVRMEGRWAQTLHSGRLSVKAISEMGDA